MKKFDWKKTVAAHRANAARSDWQRSVAAYRAAATRKAKTSRKASA
jgi:hypothetical protein